MSYRNYYKEDIVMKNYYYGRRVRIFSYNSVVKSGRAGISDTGKTGRLFEVDINSERVMVEDETGELVILFYKLVGLI
jgi:ribosomal protein L21E